MNQTAVAEAVGTPKKRHELLGRSVLSWAFFDFGSSAFNTLMVTFVFNVYFVRVLAGDPQHGTVLWTRTSTRRSTDVVPKSQVRYAGSGSGSLNPPLPSGGGSRWLEPLIVIGVVAGLVVLFYSNRN